MVNTEAGWTKSSYSGTEGGNCVEVALHPHTVHIRDSKLNRRSDRGDAPELTVPARAWTEFVAHVGA